MTLEEALARIQEPDALEVLRPHWEDSLAALEPGVPSFLHPEEFLVSREWCGFGPEVDAPLSEAAQRIAGDPALLRLAWHCHRLLFEHTEYKGTEKWPALERALGELNGAFYLLVCMSMVPRVRAVHQAMGVPEAVSRETCLEVSAFADFYRRMTGGSSQGLARTGRLGITLNTIPWLRHYPAARLFRLGRMEYMLKPFGGGVEAYRHRQTGQVVALADDGVRFDGAGYVDGTAGRFDEEHGWTATLARDEEGVTGYPVSPLGMAVRKQTRLAGAEWECVLKKGDDTLDMHIPAGGGMTLERCGDSMRRATAFFRQFFPDRPFRTISCCSWIFNTQFEEIPLPSDNLVRYQRELYLFPIRSSGQDGLWFIFQTPTFDPASLPRESSLQRAVADYLAAGHTWRGGGMFYLVDDLERFGTQPYRRG